MKQKSLTLYSQIEVIKMDKMELLRTARFTAALQELRAFMTLNPSEDFKTSALQMLLAFIEVNWFPDGNIGTQFLSFLKKWKLKEESKIQEDANKRRRGEL